MKAFLSRLADVAYGYVVLWDMILCFLWLAPLYIVGLASKPTGHQMISAYVGRAAINGHRWALRAEKVINWLLSWRHDDHCRRAARHYAGIMD